MLVFGVPWFAEVPSHDQRSPSQILAVQDRNPRLYALYEETSNELQSCVEADLSVPDSRRREAFVNWQREMRDPEESAYIVTTLFEAYAQNPPDWGSVSAALFVAGKGVEDLRVEMLNRSLVQSVAELPDEALNAVAVAIGNLALSSNTDDIELVKKATSRNFVGVEAEPSSGYVGAPREILCQCALVALYTYPPLDQAIDALGDVAKSYKGANSGFAKSMRVSAKSFRDQLKRVQKGKRVPMPSP
jgi:hypothetical protein